jgi:hypothetical protein
MKKHIFFLGQVASLKLTTIWPQEWKRIVALDLRGMGGNLWESYVAKRKSSHVRIRGAYVAKLKSSHVRIRDVVNESVWSKNTTRVIYTPRVGYKAPCDNERVEEDQWLWECLWKF